jgi:hypothetical protein
MADASDHDQKPDKQSQGGDHTKKRLREGRRIKPAKANSREAPLAFIKRELLRKVDAVKDGQPTKITAMAAILYQLLQKSLSGDKKADRVLQSYHELANRSNAPTVQIEIEFVDNEYTMALAAAPEDDDA